MSEPSSDARRVSVAALSSAALTGAYLLRRRWDAAAWKAQALHAPTPPACRCGAGSAPVDRWACACGQDFRISGAGRHRVHWLPGAPAGEPVLTGRCPACDRALT